MPDKLEDRCAVCPELLADGYGKCDHRRCMDCMARELTARALTDMARYDMDRGYI